MGEYADDAIDREIEFACFGPRRRRKASYSCACNACGETGLRWRSIDGAWVLFDDTDEKHVCAFGPSGQPAGAEEFD